MNEPRRISDEDLARYADGEADPALRARIEAALADDGALAARLSRLRALRARLGRAYAAELEEPLSPRLQTLAASLQGGAAAAQAKAPTAAAAVDLAAARRERRRPWAAWTAWGGWAVAAALLVAVAPGLMQTGSDAQPWTQQGQRLVAQAALADALDRVAPAAGPIAVPVTVPTAAGGYCRAFTLPGQAGLACREPGETGWTLRLLAAAPAAPAASAEALRLAGSALPDAVLRAVDAAAAGESLDPAALQAAQARGWRR